MLEEFKDFLVITGLSILQTGLSVYIKTQAQVYIWGRMLEVIKNNRSKNLTALISTIIFTVGYIYKKGVNIQWLNSLWTFFDIFSVGILWYVLFGFKLFSRMDTLQDKKIAKDK